MGNNLAAIQYAGVDGISSECFDAVCRFIQFRDVIDSCFILTADDARHSRGHALLLRVNLGDLVAIKSGFASGYAGEGPRTFSKVIALMHGLGIQLEEVAVSRSVLHRLDESAMTQDDIDLVMRTAPIRPKRLFSYVNANDSSDEKSGVMWNEFPSTIPFAVVHPRLLDLAKTFWDDPDARLLTAYRRLEDGLRERTGLTAHGTKLFSAALRGDGAKLEWRDCCDNEATGRVNLFTGVYMAFRNRRAHKESGTSSTEYLREFLLLNELYHLAESAVAVQSAQQHQNA